MNFSALSFFQPAFLWALGFLSAILFLHFFRRRIIKKMDISTLRFFPASAVNKSRVRKLVDLLLLLARLLLVAALVLIFAGLHDRESPLVTLRDPRGVIYTWIDPTVSMEFVEGGKSAGQRAAELADSLIKILPSTVEHYRFDHETGRFVSTVELLGCNGFATDKFTGRFGPVNIYEAVDAFMAASSSEPSAVFMVLSDFQRGVTDGYDSLLSILSDNGKKVINISLIPAAPYNYSVKARAGASHRDGISATVYAYGAPLDTVLVEMFIGDLRIGHRSVSCPADDSVLVTFEMPPAKIGSWGRVELHAADPLQFDNRDFFTVTDDLRRSVLIVGDIARNRVIQAAMRASAPAFWDPVLVKDGTDLSYEVLNSADLVIINNFNGRSRILESFISGAGSDKGIIVTLDPDREDDFGRAYVLGSGLTRRALTVNSAENGIRPVLTETSSALWRGFPALSSNHARVYRYMSPISGDPLVRLGNAQTLAASIDHSGGANLVIAVTPLGITQANNLCETGFFVPFMDRIGRRALSGRGQSEEPWYAGYPARNPFFGVGRGGTLYDLDGRLVASWSNQPFVKIDRPGVYSLTSSAGETTHRAAGVHPSESDMTFIRPNVNESGSIYYFEYERFLEQAENLGNNVWSHRLWIILGIVLCCEVFLWKRKS